MRNGVIWSVSLGISLILTSCGQVNDKPDLSSLGKVSVISREEGSGTREEFENIIGTDSSGTDNVAFSTVEVSDMVKENIDAIGYMAYSTGDISGDIKYVFVNGTELNEENIINGKYPLCRNYYLAYSGELSPAENDFLTYVMSAGQAIAESECVEVKKSSSFLSDKSSGKIKICGSTSMAPLIEKMAEDYKNFNPSIKIEIVSTDSSNGLNSAIRGECDFAMSSRELVDYENELLTKKAIAKDGIAVVVNRDNPINNISKKQIKKIYDNKIENWSDLT